MLVSSRSSQKETGDTLIEVLFAITVFAFIVVASLALMNQGVSASQRSLEITTVRQQMDAQAETLRFLHGSYVEAYRSGITFDTTDAFTSPAEEYSKIISYIGTIGRTSASVFGGSPTCKVPDNAPTDFILNPITATLVTGSPSFKTASTTAKLVYSGNVLTRSEGLWIEPIRVAPDVGSTAGYIDFHIRSCWDAPGLSIPMNLGTIVRLYEPRN